MRDLDSNEFNAAVEREFAFLRENGFEIPNNGRVDTPLTAGVLFVGRNVAVELGLDRRDEAIDCMISRVEKGTPVRNDTPGGYRGHLHALLVENRHYRGSFTEFRPQDQNERPDVRELRMYANVLKALAPDIVADSDNVFESER